MEIHARIRPLLPSILVLVLVLSIATGSLHQARQRAVGPHDEQGQGQAVGATEGRAADSSMRTALTTDPSDGDGVAAAQEDERATDGQLIAPSVTPAYASIILSWASPVAGLAPLPNAVIAEYVWLAACQTPLGALTMAPGDTHIVPYFANFAAMALLRWDVPAVERYMHWYLGRLNGPDRFGLDGTIYDYVWERGREASLRDYDSADSYASTFLSLVARYVLATGNGQFVLDNLVELRRIAGVCLALQDPVDDLVWAKPDHRYKFLMDNCEVNLGLEAWAEVLRTIGLWHEAEPYAAAAKRIRVAIENELWDGEAGVYAWAKTAAGLRAQRRRWYPDAVCQLYPGLFGVIDPAGPRNQELLSRLDAAYPRWPSLGSGDTFPWSLVAYANVLGGRTEQAQRFVDAVTDRYSQAGRPWPWYNMEAAFLADTVLELAVPGSSAPVRR